MNKNFRKLVTTAFLALSLVVGLGVVSLQPVLAAGGAGDLTLKKGVEAGKTDETDRELFEGEGSIFKTVINVLLFLIGAISVIMIIYGGIRYVTSGGDQGAVTSAKNTILYAVVGLVVAILAYAIVNFVVGAFGVGD